MTAPAAGLGIDLDGFAARRPGAFRLAVLGSLATRLEPQLLRALRLRLAPDIDAGAEADLWFSPLVEIRAASGIVFRKEALPRLRMELARGGLLRQAWTVTFELHRQGAPVLLAEEELGYLALAGLDQPGARERAQQIMRRLIAGLVDESREEAVNWADRAVLRLPESLFEIEETRLLAMGAAYRGAALPTIVDRSVSEGWGDVDWLRPKAGSGGTVGVRLVEGGVEVGPPALPESHRIELPPLRDCYMELRWSEDGVAGSAALRPDSARTQFIATPAAAIEIAVAGGQRYRLRRQDESKPQFIRRNRPPRVRITYPDAGTGNEIDLPFVIGVISDLAGENANRPGLASRRFVEVDMDSLDSFLRDVAPTLSVSVDMADGPSQAVTFAFHSMSDFKPAALVRQIPQAAEWLDRRQHLSNLLRYLDGKIPLSKALMRFVRGIARPRDPDADPGNLAALVASMTPHSEQDANELSRTITTLREMFARNPGIWPEEADAWQAVENAIGLLDGRLTVIVRSVLRDPAFLRLEGAWRGLGHLVFNTETDQALKIKVLDVSRSELLDDAKEGLHDSEMYRKLYEAEFGMLGGEPYGCLAADFFFDHADDDVALLERLGSIGAAAACPVIAGARPSLLGIERWTGMETLGPLDRAFETPGHARWQALRDSENARFLGLCLPRVLAREPYSVKMNPVEEFNFEEATEAPEDKDLCWMNAAYPMVANVGRAMKEYGWPAHIRGVQTGGEVLNLPSLYMHTDDGGLERRPPTEITISEPHETELSNAGLLPLFHLRNTDRAAFIGSQSLYRPKRHENEKALAVDHLGARFPYIFTASRFVHCVKCMVRDRIGMSEPPDLERWLQQWLLQYVNLDPLNSAASEKPRKPLSSASIEVFRREHPTGDFSARLYLCPYFQLESTDVGMEMEISLPLHRG